MVPGAGIEPARIAPLVFETNASTNSAIRASRRFILLGATKIVNNSISANFCSKLVRLSGYFEVYGTRFLPGGTKNRTSAHKTNRLNPPTGSFRSEIPDGGVRMANRVSVRKRTAGKEDRRLWGDQKKDAPQEHPFLKRSYLWDYSSSRISRILMAAVAMGVPGPKMAAAPALYKAS